MQETKELTQIQQSESSVLLSMTAQLGSVHSSDSDVLARPLHNEPP